jgi:hypothetical protein
VAPPGPAPAPVPPAPAVAPPGPAPAPAPGTFAVAPPGPAPAPGAPVPPGAVVTTVVVGVAVVVAVVVVVVVVLLVLEEPLPLLPPHAAVSVLRAITAAIPAAAEKRRVFLVSVMVSTPYLPVETHQCVEPLLARVTRKRQKSCILGRIPCQSSRERPSSTVDRYSAASCMAVGRGMPSGSGSRTVGRSTDRAATVGLSSGGHRQCCSEALRAILFRRRTAAPVRSGRRRTTSPTRRIAAW